MLPSESLASSSAPPSFSVANSLNKDGNDLADEKLLTGNNAGPMEKRSSFLSAEAMSALANGNDCNFRSNKSMRASSFGAYLKRNSSSTVGNGGDEDINFGEDGERILGTPPWGGEGGEFEEKERIDDEEDSGEESEQEYESDDNTTLDETSGEPSQQQQDINSNGTRSARESRHSGRNSELMEDALHINDDRYVVSPRVTMGDRGSSKGNVMGGNTTDGNSLKRFVNGDLQGRSRVRSKGNSVRVLSSLMGAAPLTGIIVVDLNPVDRNRLVDVGSVMNIAPHVVLEDCPLSRGYRLFTHLGLRHLVVLGERGGVRGIVTRANLLEESVGERLREVHHR